MGYVLILSGIVFLLYYVAAVMYAGVGASMIWIWLLGGVGLFGIGCGLLYIKQRGITLWIPTMVKGFAGGILLLGVMMFVLGEIWIFSGMMQEKEKNLDYIIVLGCQVKGERPSRALKERLDTAREYMEENPETIAILSGGQGTGEYISEAKCMYTYLTDAGISGTRLIMEDTSTTTVENLQFSHVYVEEENASVGVISNNFHIYRSVAIAKKLGYTNVCGIPAPSRSLLQPHYLVRECLALWKEKILKNI